MGESKSLDRAILIDDVDDTARIQRIEPKVMYQDRYVGSRLYRGTRPIEAYPWHAEHLPRANRLHCPLPRDFPFAKLDTIAVHVVARWDGSGRRSDLRVRKARVLLLRNDTSNLFFRWSRQAEQGDRYSPLQSLMRPTIWMSWQIVFVRRHINLIRGRRVKSMIPKDRRRNSEGTRRRVPRDSFVARYL